MRTAEVVTATATFLLLAAAGASQAPPREQVLNFVPVQTKVNFTLGATLHTVHGTFNLKRGAIHYNPATGAINGEVVIDAASGQTGNDGRDRKMHKEVLESARYPEIVFRPDRVEGTVAAHGASTPQVHGVFSVHGTDHEMTIPLQVEMAPDHWAVTCHFTIPYVKWGLKNPSTFLLRVDQTVDMDVHAAGLTPL